VGFKKQIELLKRLLRWSFPSKYQKKSALKVMGMKGEENQIIKPTKIML